MRQDMRIGVIIPALNEEDAIGRVIAAIPDWVDEIVVADNGSTDRTAIAAEVAGAQVTIEPVRGYGAACQAGIKALASVDIVVFLDGDYSDYPEDMHLLVDPIAANEAGFVVGSRVLGVREKGALTPQQRFGNWLACRLMNRFFGTEFTDLGPFRAIRSDSLQGLAMHDRAYGWTVEMQIKAARAGISIKEVPVRYRPRIGVSKISGTVRGTLLAGYTILSVIARASISRPSAR
jgi:glycosyltransferase involved in cell wall biosynthesis